MTTAESPPLRGGARVDGKFLEVEGARFLVKGVAYGTFAPGADGVQFPVPSRVAADFAAMSGVGINTVRTYTVPPEWLLDVAASHGLRVMVGMPWSQHVAFLTDRPLGQQIRREAVETVRRLHRHPAALLFAVGNEIPASVVRWHGEPRVATFLRSVYDDVKAASPGSLLTYVNFPPTEYVELDFFDVCAFNVYLHRHEDLRAYLARVQHIAGLKPLLLAEAGADSIREGDDGQASIVAMHLRTAFVEGACGAVAFSWTDEWWRGGHDVDDWAFGLVDRARRPKPALGRVAEAFADAPFLARERSSPKVTVVVCAYNAASTLDECLQSLVAQSYPNYEVLVVNDGSRDATGEIARRYPVRLIEVPNAGLSAARNLGWANATGEIVAYTDADVRADRDWLRYLVTPIVDDGFAAAGGPNVVPSEDPWVAQCVARAPGGPTHVLLDDRVAEHVPGCNMGFWRHALEAVGGFNPVYQRAGDDVDICWRLQAKGLRIGFAPAALVWHHHRPSVKAYWRQQVGYGEGETWLDAHHPEKFLRGNMLWRGRIYSPLPFVRSLSGRRINTGVWGSAAFPAIYRTDPHGAQFLPHTPAWLILSLAMVIAGVLLTPFPALGWVLLVTGLLGWTTTIARCIGFARRTDLSTLPAIEGRSLRASRLRYRALIAWLHFIQPIARIYGRVKGMLAPPASAAAEHVSRVPWKAPLPTGRDLLTSARLLLGRQSERQFWSESWLAPADVLNELSGVLRASRPAPLVELDDGWHADRDLSLAIAGWGWLHVRMLVEEHAEGRCLLRVGVWMRLTPEGLLKTVGLVTVLVAATSAAVVLRFPVVSQVATLVVAVLAGRAVWHGARAFARIDRATLRAVSVRDLAPLGSPRAPWAIRASRPVTGAPVVRIAAVLVAVASVFVSAGPVVQWVREHLPFGTGAVVGSVPSAGESFLSGSVAVTTGGDIVFADASQGTIRRLRVRLPRIAVFGPQFLSVRAASTQTGGPPVSFPDAADVAIAPNGELLVADAVNNRICRIDPRTGRVVTIAGDGSAGLAGDRGQAAQASFDEPTAIAVASNGDIYVADTGNDRIRLLQSATGLVTTVVGGGVREDGSIGDGEPAVQAVLKRPRGIAVAPNGDLYVSDTGNGRVRRVDARTRIITTVASDLIAPAGLALVSVRGSIEIFVADEDAGVVRILLPNGGVSTLAAGRGFVRPSRVAYHPGGWLIVKDASADSLTAVRLPARARAQATTKKGTPAGNAL